MLEILFLTALAAWATSGIVKSCSSHDSGSCHSSGNSSDSSSSLGHNSHPPVGGGKFEVYRPGEYGNGPPSVRIDGRDCQITDRDGYTGTTRVHHQGAPYSGDSQDYRIDDRGNVTKYDKYS